MFSLNWMRSELRRTFLAAPITATVGASALAASPPARASESAPLPEPAAPRLRRHALYVDAFGRGGLWGLGYDYQLTDRFAVGATTSFTALDSQRIWSLSPYLGFYPATSGHHRWLVQGGPQILHSATISPVPEWNGMSSTGVRAVVASGYEYRSRFLFRLYGMATIGGSGVTPWVGISLGGTLR